MAMKIIKRKSAVRPITGSIVDSTNIADKSTNTYSAEIIDNIIEEKIGITQVTDYTELFTLKSGYTLNLFNIHKDRNRYFGDITIVKNSGAFTNQEAVLEFTKPTTTVFNSGCFLGGNEWVTNKVGYCYCNSTAILVGDSANENYCTFAKIHLDIVVAE